jgi:putative NADH-flavin reductase
MNEGTTLAASRQGVTAMSLDVSDQEALSQAVEACDVVVR